ncbi:MAG: recombinase RecA, partial [Gammaproteobacteria bacterium]
MEDLRTKNQSSEKVKALAAALSQIEKQFGKGSIMRFGEN